MNSEVKKFFFVVNKFSGTGHRRDFETLIARECGAYGSECAWACTERPAHATSLAAEAVKAGFTTIVAVGGDGTVNEVAQGLLHSSATMGIIPKGSGNGLARHLGIPLKTLPAVRSLFASQTIKMDTFRLNGRLSLNVSGIGFDGYVAKLFAGRKTRGLQAYTRLALSKFMQFKEFNARITAGNNAFDRKAFVVAIANASQYGNNAKIAPRASVCDGQLNVALLQKIPVYRLDLLYSLFSGAIDQSSYCENLDVKQATIQLDAPLPYHVDGEPVGIADNFTIEILPASLNVHAPKERPSI